MANFQFTELLEWKIRELRDFVDFAQLDAKGRSKKTIVDKIETQISPQDCMGLIKQFQSGEQVSKVPTKPQGQKTSKNQLHSAQNIHRIKTLENQVRALYQRINKIENLVHSLTQSGNIDTPLNLEPLLLQLIPSGTGITTDRLLNHPEVRSISPKAIERAILNLVDEDRIMVAEGKSQRKLASYIGRIIRK